MDVKDAIQNRRAIRAFTDEPVSQETLSDILRLASRAVSAVNSQPWEIAVITGDVLKNICEDNMEQIRAGKEPDRPFPVMEGVYRKRSVAIAKQLFASMGIAREDREKRNWWGERGYQFFGAPVGIVLYMDRWLEEHDTHSELDIGCIIQNICLAAMEYGLGTCVAYQPIEYERGLRKYLDIPESKQLICGIAIGHPDWEFPANQVISTREELEDFVAWYGF